MTKARELKPQRQQSEIFLVNRFRARCGCCGEWIPAGQTVRWNRSMKFIRHIGCLP